MFVVAGATGHVGTVIAHELLGHGEKTRVLVRDANKGASWSKAGAELAVGALDDANSLTKALNGATGFFTLLPPNYQATNFYAYQRKTADTIAAAVKESRVPHVVILSSIGADLADGNGPIKGLHYLENALRATGTKVTAIRAGYFQENVGNSVKPAREAGIFPNFTPSQDYPTPMIATRDIGLLAAAELQIPSAKSETIDLEGPAYSIRQVAELLGGAIGKNLKIVDIPPAAHVATLQQAGMSKDMSEAFAEMYSGFASGAIKTVGDRKKLGRTRLETVIRTLV